MQDRLFQRYVGIDYSGAGHSLMPLRGLRLCVASGMDEPQEIMPFPGRGTHWSRMGIAVWLNELLSENIPSIVGIDHGFSFPLAYYEHHRLSRVWAIFLEDFCHHWPLDRPGLTVDQLRRGFPGTMRSGSARWRRLTELRCRAKSVFHFDVPGSVAKSTHTGLPWLRFLREQHRLSGRIHFWPMDGWEIPVSGSLLLEAYPSLYRPHLDLPFASQDQNDAYAIAKWLQREDAVGRLPSQLTGEGITADEKNVAMTEGWILGC